MFSNLSLGYTHKYSFKYLGDFSSSKYDIKCGPYYIEAHTPFKPYLTF